MTKIIELGRFGPTSGSYRGAPLNVRVRIEMQPRDGTRDGKLRLSISGDTYYQGRRDIESGGQILDDVRRLLDDPEAVLLRPREQIQKLLEVWERWHLNDMRAGCEHQRASWKTDEQITLVTYQLKGSLLLDQRNIEERATEQLKKTGKAEISDADRALLNLPFRITVGADLPAPGSDYEEKQRKTQLSGWVRPEEHPKGLLCKPCEVCGYKYGSAWLHERLPTDVIAWIEAL